MRLIARLLALTLAGLLALAAAASHGCHPRPLPDGGVYTPSGVVAALDTTASILDVLVPVLRPIVRVAIANASATARQAVDLALAIFVDAASAWQAGRATWEARGGDRCTAYALSGALASATVDLAARLAEAGVGWGPDLDALATSLGRVIDRQLDPCALADGGPLAASGHAGDTIRSRLNDIAATARQRGVALVDLPPASGAR